MSDAKKYLEGRQKGIVDMLKLPDAVLSVMSQNIATNNRTNILFDNWGPSQPTLMAATIMDILHIKQMGDDDYSPSQFVCGGCDPAIPLLIDTAEVGYITSHMTPYMKREWTSTWCGDEDMLKRAMLSELPNLPWGRELNMTEKQNLLLAAANRQMQGEMRAAEVRMWTDDFLYGKMAIEGPGIKPNTVLDMERNKKLFSILDGDGWCSPNASRVDSLRSFADHVYNESGDMRSYPNVFVMDKVAKAKFFSGVEFQECDPCGGNYNPRVSRPGVSLAITVDRADQGTGIQRLNYRDDVLGNATFYCIDEMRNECVLDENGKDTGEKRKVPVLPAGTVLAFHSENHAPIGLHGRIQTNRVNSPMFRYTRRVDGCCPEDDKIGIRSETAPLYFNRRENTVGMFFIAPTECPPPKHVCPVPFECDPTGGLKAVQEAIAAEARVATITANAAVEAATKQQAAAQTAAQLSESDKKKKGDK